MPEGVAEPLGFGIVISLITYLSIVIGELVPKQLALRHPESIACAMAPLMLVVSKVAAPAVWLLNASTRHDFPALRYQVRRATIDRDRRGDQVSSARPRARA